MSKGTKAQPAQQPIHQEVPQQAPIQEKIVQEVPHADQEGNGRFEYQDGTVYQGQWKLVQNNKVKYGSGTVVIASTLSQDSGQKEEYTGDWVDDMMEGDGVYRYKSGAQFSGQWKANKHHGLGKYTFVDGCVYEGEWFNHKMHGEGVFIDIEGNRWEGEFVEGIYQSKMQKQLKMEKMLKKKENDIKQNSITFFAKFQEAFAKSDKKTFKENLLPFFVTQEEIKLYVKDPFPKFEEKTPEKWNDAIKFVSEYKTINILRQNTQAKIIDPNNILVAQFSGIGQIAEFLREQDNRVVKLVLCNAFENSWVIVYFHDTLEPEVQAGKKK